MFFACVLGDHEAEELDEEDLSLIEENLGIRLQRVRTSF